MNDSSDLVKLYSQRILALAADIPLTTPIETPQAAAKVRSPLCGSTVTVEIKVHQGTVTAFGQNVKACALGQASASVLGRNIVGRNRKEIALAHHELKEMLTNHGPPPTVPFDELCVLQPARDYKNRHASIMLVFDATLEAFDQAELAGAMGR
ncbi:MAG: iron-sulfur cluster assembly scaffold protein [Rhodobacteraceae bacterium]|nr:iron-sulfur cluster assembly scaffold protein [Paracoccaceae bacterium]MCY4197808.1 iron-sulfur cluster assembly scaffold protein [Paracoccaceae bacterium]